MVKYAENWVQKLVNNLVIISLIAIIVLFILFLTGKDAFLEPYLVSIDIIINAIFLIDLGFIYQKRKSVRSFLYHNWLDIIACIPISFTFRAVKLVRLVRVSRVITRQSKFVRLTSKIPRLRITTWLRGSRAFSKEANVRQHLQDTRDSITQMQLNKIDKSMNRIYKILANTR